MAEPFDLFLQRRWSVTPGDRGFLLVPNVIRYQVDSDRGFCYVWQKVDGSMGLAVEEWDWDEAARYVGGVRVVIARNPQWESTDRPGRGRS